MVAETKDQTSGTSSQEQSLPAQSNVKGTGSMTKVRKPYTISKQRERWTDEEHQRFLEALKMYGRAWPQIEDHVGTKTAIQIRSHAQKFFAKVDRDSKTESPIAIPPPRPKKKPIHPYPRKVTDLTNAQVIFQPQNSPSSVSVTERENNLSPVSVLSQIGCDTLESTVSQTHKSRLSPSPCSTDDRYSKKEDDGFNVKYSAASVMDDKETMKSNWFPQETACSMNSSSTEDSCTSIKLFGKTVVVKDSPKHSSENVEKSEDLPSECDGKFGMNSNSLFNGSRTNNFNSHDFESIPNSINSFCSPHQSFLGFPWWARYQNMSNTQFTTSLKDEQVQMEGGGSNTRLMNEPKTEDQNLESKHLPNSVKRSSAKGFVPYKRCLAEREENKSSSMSYIQERESQRARVCS